MTYIDKLRQDHPEWSEFEFGRNVGAKCPGEFGYDEHCITGEGCGDDVCKRCWEQEYPVYTVSEQPSYANKQDALRAVLGIPNEDSSEPHILDSGNRTQFEGGGVRDMREGKGRFDYVPLDVMAYMLGDEKVNHDAVVYDISVFMKERDTAWLDAALSNFANVAYNGCMYTMFLEVAKHFEEGAKKYGPDNWRLGIPVWCYIDSAVRHYMKWKRGDNDEPHDRAFVWNLLCCIWEVDYSPRAEEQSVEEETE